MKKLIILFVLPFTLNACVTAHPEQVPAIQADRLPTLKLEGLKPQTVDLTVQNHRAINQSTGNSAQVEAAVQSALANSLSRGGIQISSESKNKLNASIEDCKNNVDPNVECVRINLSLKNKRMEIEVGGTSQTGLQREGSSYTLPGGGDISKAYQGALQLVIEGLPEQLDKVLKKMK